MRKIHRAATITSKSVIIKQNQSTPKSQTMQKIYSQTHKKKKRKKKVETLILIYTNLKLRRETCPRAMENGVGYEQKREKR